MGMSIEKVSHRYANIFQGDRAIWMIFFFLCAISLIEVYSAASNLSYKAGDYWTPVLRHALFLFIGAIVAVVIHNIPCRWFKFYPVIVIPASFVMLLMAMFVGVKVNEASRWLSIFGVPLQPSEIAKGGVVVGTALILSALQTDKGADRHAFKYIMWITLPIVLLIFSENISTALLLFTVVVLMMFIGRVPFAQLGKLLGVLAIIAVCGISVLTLADKSQLSSIPFGNRLATLKTRVMTYAEGNSKPFSVQDFDMNENAQIAHANIAIATSNVIGKFPGNSVERDFLSQAFSDFIYAIIIEEMGIFGGAFVVLLYVVLLFRASKIANRCERNFPAFLVLGLSLLMVIQAIINMAVAVGLFPVTGQPLPLISRGGTSTIINCIYIGMILSVSRFAKKRIPESGVAKTNMVESEFIRDEGIQ